MSVSKELVEEVLRSKLQAVHLIVNDISGGCGTSFDVSISSPKFDNVRLLERHRMVNTALADLLKNIHALSIKRALTPQQWVDQLGNA